MDPAHAECCAETEERMLTRALPYYEFSEGIYEIDEFDCVSVFVIVGEKRALVLDTGTGIGDLRWVIENRITDKPYDVILTHNHVDHIGGAGFFDEVFIHEADYDWSELELPVTVEERRWYANLIAGREDKSYIYSPETDITEWPKEPVKKVMKDGQVFDLGGRKVTVYHCPGHTAGECVAIDDKSRILFCGDACNRNFLPALKTSSVEEAAGTARKGLERIYAMKGTSFDMVYNAHHDYRGFASPLGENVLPDLIRCLKDLENGSADIREVPDPLSDDGGVRKVAVYRNVEVAVGK